jgi:hypothetical protein
LELIKATLENGASLEISGFLDLIVKKTADLCGGKEQARDEFTIDVDGL